MEYNLEDQDNEERTVTTLAAAFACVWRDNPALFKWIDETIKAGP
jgi:hypothetical protein